MKNADFLARLGYARDGLRAVWARERSFRTQVIVAVAAVVVTALLRPELIWCAAIALCIALVLGLELMNSALEYLIDHLHPGIAPEIKRAKDAAAAAVLLASAISVCVGVLMVASVWWR
jgi:diacylglycerol kinase